MQRRQTEHRARTTTVGCQGRERRNQIDFERENTSCLKHDKQPKHKKRFTRLEDLKHFNLGPGSEARPKRLQVSDLQGTLHSLRSACDKNVISSRF